MSRRVGRSFTDFVQDAEGGAVQGVGDLKSNTLMMFFNGLLLFIFLLSVWFQDCSSEHARVKIRSSVGCSPVPVAFLYDF